MQRPDFITEDQLKRWDKLLTLPDFDKPVFREVGYAGCWLQEQLTAAIEIADNELDLAVNGAGQIMVGRDPWRVAALFLEDALNGKVYKPGAALADALLRGELDERFGKGADLVSKDGFQNVLRSHGVSSLKELVTQMMEEHGCKTVEELKTKLKTLTAEAEAEFESR